MRHHVREKENEIFPQVMGEEDVRLQHEARPSGAGLRFIYAPTRRCMSTAVRRRAAYPCAPPFSCGEGPGCALAEATFAGTMRGGGFATLGASEGFPAIATETPELLNSDFSTGG